jgi:hypothetical protein
MIVRKINLERKCRPGKGKSGLVSVMDGICRKEYTIVANNYMG